MGHVLIVDDDRTSLKMVGHLLQRKGHQVFPADSGSKALGFLSKRPVDMVVTDLVMPGMDGFALLRAIQENQVTRDLPVMILSAVNSLQNRVRGYRRGVHDYLAKPFDPEELLVRVEAVLRRGKSAVPALEGRLEAVSPLELFQGMSQNRKSGILEIKSDQNHGYLHLRHGEVVEASWGKYAGLEAVEAMVLLENGWFRYFPRVRALSDSSPAKNLGPALVNALWIADELEKRRNLLPEENQVLKPGAAPGDPPTDWDRIPIAFVYREIGKKQDTTLVSLIETTSLLPDRLRLAVCWLAERGCLAEPRASAVG